MPLRVVPLVQHFVGAVNSDDQDDGRYGYALGNEYVYGNNYDIRGTLSISSIGNGGVAGNLGRATERRCQI